MIINKKKVLSGLLFVLSRLFILLMAAQIVLGAGWLFMNMGKQPMFHETENYIKAAENMVIDEYMGILYPLIIRISMFLEGVCGISYYTIIYLLQLIAALYAGMYLLKRMEQRMTLFAKGYRKGFFLAYLITFPLLLQMHLAILPESFLMSLSILLICDGVCCFSNSSFITGRKLIKMCGLWILCAMLQPDYLWILGLFLSVVYMKAVKQNRKLFFQLFAALLCTILCFGVISKNTQTPGSMGRIQKSIGSTMILRFVWPDFMVNSYFWNEEVKETFDEEELIRFSRYPEAVIYEFGPVLEEKYGYETAESVYRKMAFTCIDLGTKQRVLNIGRDFLANLCPQISLQMQLNHNKSSLTGWNYGRLQDNAPVLTKYYLQISLAGWNVMSMIGMILFCIKFLQRFKKEKKKGFFSCLPDYWLPIIVLMLFASAWYTMTTGIQDYKNMGILSLLWTSVVIHAAQQIVERKERVIV